MKRLFRAGQLSLGFLAVLLGIPAGLGAQDLLWYEAPAAGWMQALPVGNGRLGAMVFGDPSHERLQLNEDSLWPGAADWGDARGTRGDLDTLRLLLNQGKTRLADSLIVERFSYKSVARSHQTGGDLYLDFQGERRITDYRRSLDLDRALAEVRYRANGYAVEQQVFASYPDSVLVIRLRTEDPAGLNLTIRMDRPDDEGVPTVSVRGNAPDELMMAGTVTQRGGKRYSEPYPIDYGVQFNTLLRARTTGGSVTRTEGGLRVSGAPELLLTLATATSFYHGGSRESIARRTLDRIASRSFEELLAAHLADYQKLYRRVSLQLGMGTKDPTSTLERLSRVKSGHPDPGLAALLFQYGRYLLIASSRPGTLPANLQGIWNEHILAPWNADYHLNINLQMNYWPAEVANLSELHGPYFDFIDRVIERGRKTARMQYQMDGSVVHHTTDIWAPAWMRAERAYWGSWIHGGGWAVQQYWEHFLFTRDTTFLRERAYPALQELAAFYADWLVWDAGSEKWISSPETSPENSYYTEAGIPAAVSRGSAMGHQIIAATFDHYLEAAGILGIDNWLTRRVATKNRDLFPGVQVGPDGRILEWNRPYDEPEKGHRHISHLFALHPGNTITSANPKLMEAARRSRDYRLEHGGAGTGWSRAWMISIDARLEDAPGAANDIRKFMEISLAENLFDMHPPFQIDGNFGFTAGVAECLLQSHEGFIRLLPALPAFWPEGAVSGLRARGGLEVSIAWEDGRLTRAGFTAASDGTYAVRYAGNTRHLELRAGETLWLEGPDLE